MYRTGPAKMPFVVATYVYASSQGQRTHSARTKSIPAKNVSILCSAPWLPMISSLISNAQLSVFPAQLPARNTKSCAWKNKELIIGNKRAVQRIDTFHSFITS
jgi:hypothetical protein